METEGSQSVEMVEGRLPTVYMWGYLPGALPEKSPILSPVPVSPPATGAGADSWKDICGGGCGFAIAISGSGKLITWGATDDEGQIYLTSGKHGEIPEPFSLPIEAPLANAAAGWAHCVSVTDAGEVYTWGWKECVPTGKLTRDVIIGGNISKNNNGKPSDLKNGEVSPASRGPNLNGATISQTESRKTSDEIVKRRRISTEKEESENLPPGDELFTLSPCHVKFGPGVRIVNVAAGGRHTLALSDVGQVWGWGYGGEGQLGLGSRIKMVSSPHLIPCLEQSSSGKDRPLISHHGSVNSSVEVPKEAGSRVKAIACGGRHSAVITDSGSLLAFGWGLYGQCGQGSTTDVLGPTCISSLSGIQVDKVAAGLWHTVCVTVDGHVYSFGGNQFGQLGTGVDQLELLPRLLDAPSLENKQAKLISCGARHSVILTEDARLLSWGWNKYGQLGLGDTIDRNIPSEVPLDGCRPWNIACGWWHTLLLGESTKRLPT